MCGVVDGGIIPGMWGYEAGQSGVGDIFGWFADTAFPPPTRRGHRRGIDVHELLTELAAEQAVGEHGLIALDWHSGNRSVLVDHELSGLVVGQTLATRPEDTYRALLESTAFGTRRIIEAFTEAGPVNELVIAGGLIEEPRCSCRSTPTSPASRCRSSVPAGPGARLCHPRRRRRRRLSGHPRRRRRHGPSSGAAYTEEAAARTPTTSSTPST